MVLSVRARVLLLAVETYIITKGSIYFDCLVSNVA